MEIQIGYFGEIEDDDWVAAEKKEIKHFINNIGKLSPGFYSSKSWC